MIFWMQEIFFNQNTNKIELLESNDDTQPLPNTNDEVNDKSDDSDTNIL